MKLRSLIIVALAILGSPLVASAQVVTGPTQAVFAHADSDFAITSAYHFDFYTCASITTAGACVGQAASPFQSGFDVPKASVSGTAVARVVALNQAPASGLLSAVPVGTGIVATVLAVGDTSVPGVVGNSGPSGVSNGFFVQARKPATPGSPLVKQ